VTKEARAVRQKDQCLLSSRRGVHIEGCVAEIIQRGEFATWRAARVAGDHDLNTFPIRADPVETAGAMPAGFQLTIIDSLYKNLVI
jgi:HlyD family secretion protein